MAFTIRSDSSGLLVTRETFEEAQLVAVMHSTANPVVEDEDGNEVARVTFTPSQN